VTAANAPALPERSDQSIAWPTKLADSVFAATALAIAGWQLLSYSSLFGEAAGQMSDALLRRLPFWAVGLVAGVAYAGYWQWRETRGPFPSARRHAQAMAVVRYVVAWMIATYGFDKVVGLQFYIGLNWQDQPVDQLNGFMLTWYYFYRSRTLVLIIAALEIGGSALLLFPRTTLLGAATLLPVMVNVTLTDYLYDILGPFPAALFLTGSLVYLVAPYRERIMRLLFETAPGSPRVTRSSTTTALRVAVMLLAFLSAAVWVTPLSKEKGDTVLAGKWRVDREAVNGRPIPPDAWKGDTTVSVWSNLYLEDGYFTASSHPYVFDPTRVKYGNYTYDAGRRSMVVTLPDSVTAEFTIDTLVGDRMALHGLLNRDTLALSLTRVKPVKWYRKYWDWRSPSSRADHRP
jgi:uncharacterized membrane protein YphA (DoxX/SURF4 family)